MCGGRRAGREGQGGGGGVESWGEGMMVLPGLCFLSPELTLFGGDITQFSISVPLLYLFCLFFFRFLFVCLSRFCVLFVVFCLLFIRFMLILSLSILQKSITKTFKKLRIKTPKGEKQAKNRSIHIQSAFFLLTFPKNITKTFKTLHITIKTPKKK